MNDLKPATITTTITITITENLDRVGAFAINRFLQGLPVPHCEGFYLDSLL